ncbi:XRE family transcriptional regulator [Kribbella antibiotica]|uniref:XRE family transcriptional regulator n=1 Tax=Kribbella antibiotica TaxID=190195 RepID=A0A4R4ZSU4_9ACTN|nr:helix-turn-helix transcriptional regulator [Kribbella antibiotica]TDD61049.1 XRE family transcriptional regulator [Kribbella antibiotica]
MREIDDERFIGQQVKSYRALRGLTQKQLGAKVGKTQGAIAQYERGLRPVTDRAVLYGLAEALQVTVCDLTGQADDKANPDVAAFHAAVPRIEAALMSQGHIDQAGDPAPIERLAIDAQRALKIRMSNDYATLGGILPNLINDLYRHTLDGDELTQRRAHEELTRATFVTALATKGLGYTSLAWNAARATAEAAQTVGDPGGLAAAEFARSQVMLGTAGAVTASLSYSAGGADRLQSELTSPSELELYGMLHLQAALTSAALGKDPGAHIREAVETVRRAGDGSAYELSFGRENVIVWQMSIANELHNSREVVELAKTLNPESIVTNDRRSRYFMELARALAALGNYSAAISALLRAELCSPQQVRTRAIVKELVGHLLRRAQRELTSGELGKLAQRVGAVAA